MATLFEMRPFIAATKKATQAAVTLHTDNVEYFHNIEIQAEQAVSNSRAIAIYLWNDIKLLFRSAAGDLCKKNYKTFVDNALTATSKTNQMPSQLFENHLIKSTIHHGHSF